jgi:hypothetical protein
MSSLYLINLIYELREREEEGDLLSRQTETGIDERSSCVGYLLWDISLNLTIGYI